jgi:hypothetical protein
VYVTLAPDEPRSIATSTSRDMEIVEFVRLAGIKAHTNASKNGGLFPPDARYLARW